MKISQAELAKKLNKHRSYITRLIQKGIIEKEDDGKIDYEKALVSIINKMKDTKPKCGVTWSVYTPQKVSNLVDHVAEQRDISKGKALELMLLESSTYNQALDMVLEESPWLAS